MTDQDYAELESRLRMALSEEADRIPAPSAVATAARVPDTFDAFYGDQRGSLYRALVVALKDRDLATEAVDVGMARSFQRWRRVKGDDAQVSAYAAAYKWAAKRVGRDHGLQGFRLQRAERSAETMATETALAGLPLADRSVIATKRLLEWSDGAVATAHGISTDSVARRYASAVDKVAKALGTDRETADRRVAMAVRTEARDLIEPLGRPETVRGRAWLLRSGIALGSAAAVLVLIGGVGWFMGSSNSADPDSDRLAAGTNIERTQGTSGSSGEQSSGLINAASAGELEWSQVPLPISQGDVSAIVPGPAGFVAFGQQWDGPGQSFALLSEDGFEWENLSIPVPQQSWVSAGMGSDAGYLVAANGFDERAGRDSSFILASADGLNWERYSLPETPDSVNGIRVFTWTSVNSLVMAEDGSVTVTAYRGGDIENLDALLREALPDEFRSEWGWGTSPNGVDIYGEQGLVMTVPWEDLDLDQEVVDLVSGGLVQWTADELGGEWVETRLDLPGTGRNAWVASSASINGGMLAVVNGNAGGGSLWFRAADGEWSRVEGFEDNTAVMSLVRFGDNLVVAGNKGGQPVVYTSPDGTTWAKTDTTSLPEGAIERLVASSNGLAAIVNRTSFATQEATFDVGDLTVTLSGAGIYTVTDAQGTEVLQVFGEDAVYDGQDISLVDPESGEPVVTFTQVELDRAWESVWREMDVGNQGPEYDIAISSDGETWSLLDLDAAIGGGFYPQNVAIDRGVVVLSGFQQDAGLFGVMERAPTPTLWVASLPD